MRLTLADEFLLLAMRDGDGHRLIGGVELACGLVGSALADLALEGVVTVDDAQVRLARTTGSADGAGGDAGGDDGSADPVQLPSEWNGGVHEDLYDSIARADAPHEVASWINDKQSTKLINDHLETLVDRGLLKEEVVRFLAIFQRTTYPEVNPIPESKLRDALGRVFDGAPAGEHLGVLIALMDATGLRAQIYPDVSGKRVKEIVADEEIGDSVRDAIASIHSALAAATTTVTATVIT